MISLSWTLVHKYGIKSLKNASNVFSESVSSLSRKDRYNFRKSFDQLIVPLEKMAGSSNSGLVKLILGLPQPSLFPFWNILERNLFLQGIFRQGPKFFSGTRFSGLAKGARVLLDIVIFDIGIVSR